VARTTRQRPAHVRLIYWPVVAMTAVPAVLFCIGMVGFAAHLPAHAATPQPVALTLEVAAPLPAPSAEETSTLAADASPDAVPVAEAPAASLPEPSLEPLAAPTAPATVAATPPPPPQLAASRACETFGTSVEFVASPAEAYRRAKQNDKLVFLLHVSGNFEESGFT
jgi:hypothetical protein